MEEERIGSYFRPKHSGERCAPISPQILRRNLSQLTWMLFLVYSVEIATRIFIFFILCYSAGIYILFISQEQGIIGTLFIGSNFYFLFFSLIFGLIREQSYFKILFSFIFREKLTILYKNAETRVVIYWAIWNATRAYCSTLTLICSLY